MPIDYDALAETETEMDRSPRNFLHDGIGTAEWYDVEIVKLSESLAESSKIQLALDILDACTLGGPHNSINNLSLANHLALLDTIKVLVCGGRDYDNNLFVMSVMATFQDHFNKPIHVVHGAASGADFLAGEVAKTWHWEVSEYPAEWNKHGRAAGPIRNQQMLVDAKPDFGIAFPGGRGTQDMLGRLIAAGIPTLDLTDAEAYV